MSNVHKSNHLFHENILLQCFELLVNIDKQITLHLKEANVKTRVSPSNGIWCAFLLPAILVVYTCYDEVSLIYKLLSWTSIALLCYSIMFSIFLFISSDVLKRRSYSTCIFSSLIPTMIMYIFLKQELLFSILTPLLSTILFAWVLQLSVIKCHNTFTVGEAMVMAQSATLFLLMFLLKLLYKVHSSNEEIEFISIIIHTVLCGVGLIVAAIYVLSDNQKHIKTLAYIVGFAAIFVLLILHYILGSNCVIRICRYIFLGHNRTKIFLFWLILLIISICVLCIRTKVAVKASTVTRKSFHVLASLVFITGIIFDVNLMSLAAGIGLGVLIFVEALRKSGIEPISSALHSAFLVYADEKDCGIFAMTPIYLYLGLAFPLLVVPNKIGRELELLSGVLSIGIGDTAASWFGSKCGKYKWPDSNRTLEGTAFNILSQIGTVYALQYVGLLNVKNALLRTTFAATISGLVEARTDQVDNLVLPLVTLLAFQFTSLFC